MNFQSLEFIGFLLPVLLIYWCLGTRAQNLWLVAASAFFYGFHHAWYLLPFVASTSIDFLVAMRLEKAASHRRWLVAVSVCSNLTLLGFFKYYDFFAANAGDLLAALHLPVSLPVLQVILPAGISFYTFQSIGYVVDVYRRHVPACRNPLEYGLFVAFFPLLVAGPIQRAANFLVQVQRERSIAPWKVCDAIYLLIWGFFKKLVIADTVAVVAEKVFMAKDVSFPMLWVGVFAFCIQIYADFSGYTDIAIGTARLFGFELSGNFNHPYLARSPGDFWRRWHISLSSWIRDYLYIPLGGSRGTPTRVCLNLIIVFALTGLWHGASWNFVLWGLYYAALTLLYRFAGWEDHPRQTRAWLHSVVPVVVMFAFTNLGWLIFREHDLARLGRELLLSPFGAPAMDWKVAEYLGMLTAIYSLPLWLHALWDLKLKDLLAREEQNFFLWGQPIVACLLFSSILLLRSDISGDFIYFQF